MNYHKLFHWIASVVLALSTTMVFAQKSRIVSGIVSDQNGAPLAGVAVVIAGSHQGTTTGMKGDYSIKVTAEDVLVFSMIGYKEKQQRVGAYNKIDVTLDEDAILIEGTVITALGIKRSEKALGYSVSKVSNEAFTNSVSSN